MFILHSSPILQLKAFFSVLSENKIKQLDENLN